MRLYNIVTERMENELDIIKMIKHMRELKIIAKNSTLNHFTKFQIDHQKINIVNLSDGAKESSSTCENDND